MEGMRILAVDDEEDVLDTIEEDLEFSHVDKASDYHTAKEKIEKGKYDLAILDIMGVDGLNLLQETVSKGIPTVMLTAHAMNSDTLMTSIQRGAISFLPKEKLAELEELL
ncbi:MAG: response regulator, partial [Deltaproteobacteria bacterium]|nr:response regulator [Deltaproteobacteria bacterium]